MHILHRLMNFQTSPRTLFSAFFRDYQHGKEGNKWFISFLTSFYLASPISVFFFLLVVRLFYAAVKILGLQQISIVIYPIPMKYY